jgi:hypothetical protein
VVVPTSALSSYGGAAWLSQRVHEALGESELRVRRTIEGIGRWVDVRTYLRALTLESDRAAEAVCDAGLVGDLVVLEVDVEIRGSGAVKVSEVVEAITKIADFPHRAVRFGLGAWRGGDVVSPLELDRVRPHPLRDLALVAT